MIRIAIAGALGRTGRRVLELALSDQRFHVSAAVTSPHCSDVGTVVRVNAKQALIVDRLTEPCDVLIDFTTAEGTNQWLETCVARRVAMVIGTTGHTQQITRRIADAASSIPIVQAANFSVGVQLLASLAVQLAKALGDDYDIELVETHHRNKVDAPSGTALAIVDALLRADDSGEPRNLMHGRSGATGVRPRRQIGVHAVRMGDVVGQHELHFSGPGETITIRHTAHSRDTFAAGALRAAAWIAAQPPGLYSFAEVLSSP